MEKSLILAPDSQRNMNVHGLLELYLRNCTANFSRIMAVTNPPLPGRSVAIPPNGPAIQYPLILSSNETSNFYAFMHCHRGLTMSENLALYHAKQCKGTLFTNDGKLQDTAYLYGIQVLDLRWLYAELVRSKQLSIHEAYDGYMRVYVSASSYGSLNDLKLYFIKEKIISVEEGSLDGNVSYKRAI